ncbi:hypothetical protein FRC00_005898, partial [Tulasnella sp. 408]
FGSGWVWLVADSTGDLAVVATYGSGTMLVRSREQKGLQPSVLGEGRTASASSAFHTRSSNFSRYEAFGGTSSSPVSGSNMRFPLDPNPITPSRSVSGLKAATDAIARGNTDQTGVGYDLIPLLTCSIHEHCWLRDHGVWGKKDYLTNFWSVVDWRKLGSTYERLFGAPRKTIIRGLAHIMPLEKKYLAIKDSQQRLRNAAPEEADMLEPKRQELSAQLRGKEYPYFVERLIQAAKAALKTKVVKDILAKELGQNLQEQKAVNERLQKEVDTLNEDSRLQHQAFGAIIKKLNKLMEKEDAIQA